MEKLTLIRTGAPNPKPATTERASVLLVSHGSRDAEAEAEFRRFQARAAAALPALRIEGSFLEFSDPPVLEAMDDMADGIDRLLVLPLFLVQGGHLKNDVPAAIHHFRDHHPSLQVVYGPHLGIHPLILSVLEDRVREALGADADLGSITVLLVGRGTSDPDANSDVAKAARLFWEGRIFRGVEVCYVSLAQPDVATGLDRCRALGATRIVVLPYFLFTGVLVKRIYEQAAAWQQRHDEVEVIRAGYIGPDERVVEVLAQRIEEGFQGYVTVSCDLCKYRARMPGFEDDFGKPQGSDHHHGMRHSHGAQDERNGHHGHEHDGHEHSGRAHH